jgi:hypothetical protein
MHRPTVGLIALALLAGAAGCYWYGGGSLALGTAFWRVGLVMALVWLALPDLARVRSKFWMIVIIGVVLVAVLQPKLLALAVLFCIIYAFLRLRWTGPSKR